MNDFEQRGEFDGLFQADIAVSGPRFVANRGGYLVVGSAIGDYPYCESPELGPEVDARSKVSDETVLRVIERVQTDRRTPDEIFNDIGELVAQMRAEG
ncbi:MAG TPA: hypothetical protein VJC09_01490 [Candidatus Saccharimonadales bacterium]|nr:hypothetical protein [Candidatus Saccharimonadales bacterium]